MYKKNNICVINESEDSFYIYTNTFIEMYKLNNILKHTSYNGINGVYKMSMHKDTLVENIPLLLKNKYSIILLDKSKNVTAIHHPQNTYNSNNFAFCLLT